MNLRAQNEDPKDPKGLEAWKKKNNSVFRPTQYNEGNIGLPNVIDQISNLGTDTLRNVTNFGGSIGNWLIGHQDPKGGGLGDAIFGSAPGALSSPGRKVPSKSNYLPKTPQAPAPQQLPSFMDFWNQAQQGALPYISYDPLRRDARSRGTEYDARIQAMYDQLQGSMREDGAALAQTYQGAIDDTAARSQATQDQIQSAATSMDDRNMEVLRNLGIEQAQGNIINEGRDLNSQAARSVADAASRGQLSGDALQRNAASADQMNTGLVGAAGLEGNLQRARIQSELSSLLAQYDMQEQEANNRQAQSSFSNSMAMANALYEDDWRKRGYTDDLSREQYQMMMAQNQPDPMMMSTNFISQWMQSPEAQNMDPETALEMLNRIFQGARIYS